MSGSFPFVTSPELTGIVMSYKNSEYIADRVLPRLPPIGKQEFKYLRYTLAEGYTIPDTMIGRKGSANEVEFSATQQTASTDDYGLMGIVPFDDVQNAPTGYEPKARSILGLEDLVQLDRERRVANIVFNAATYGSANKITLSGTSQFSDTNSDPIATIMSAQDSLLMRANVLVLGRATWSGLRRNPSILKGVNKTSADKGVASLAEVAELLELDEIIIGAAFSNSAKKGQTFSKARVWGPHAALIRRDAMAGAEDGRPTFGFTAQYGSKIAQEVFDSGTGLRGSWRIRTGESVKEVISAPDLGYFIQNAVA